jgi:23S rRNA pseudouridine1911/1915/1917 synthase
VIPLIEHLRATGMSRREADQALSTGKVRLGGVPVGDPSRPVDPADVKVDPRAPRLVPGRDPVLLFRDPHLAVVWKPPGYLSVEAPGRRDPHVVGFVGHLLGDAYAVHRLDEGTSGLMLVARTARAQSALKDLFEAHRVDRRYLAIAAGRLVGERTVTGTLVRDRGDGLRGTGDGGKPATTHLSAVADLGDATLVRAVLETGRTHQVRIHLAEAGHPILGDDLYGSAAIARRAPRLALHAYRLAFVHPVGGSSLAFEVPLPDDLDRVVRVRYTAARR